MMQLDLLRPARRGRLTVYASRTGTRRSLVLFAEWGWRLLVSARGVLRSEGLPYAIDNGAWTAFNRGEPFDAEAFRRAVALLGRGAEWIAVPDVVGDSRGTMEAFDAWAPYLSAYPRMLVLQDKMTPADVDRLDKCHKLHGIFLGGSSEWKDKTIPMWADYARSRALVCHVGRVNTLRRLRACVESRVDSVDGSGVSRFTEHAIIFRRWCADLGVA
jgi:hypothetical protein